MQYFVISFNTNATTLLGNNLFCVIQMITISGFIENKDVISYSINK